MPAHAGAAIAPRTSELDLDVRDRARVEQHRALVHPRRRSPGRRGAGARAGHRAAGARHVTPTTGPSSSSSGSEPPPARPAARDDRTVLPAGAPAAIPSCIRTRALEQLLLVGGEHLAAPAPPRPRGRVAVQAQRRLERRERKLVDAQRPRERVRAHALDRGGRADRDPRLRARRAACRRRSTRRRRRRRRCRRAAGSPARSSPSAAGADVTALRSRGRRSPAVRVSLRQPRQVASATAPP